MIPVASLLGSTYFGSNRKLVWLVEIVIFLNGLIYVDSYMSSRFTVLTLNCKNNDFNVNVLIITEQLPLIKRYNKVAVFKTNRFRIFRISLECSIRTSPFCEELYNYTYSHFIYFITSILIYTYICLTSKLRWYTRHPLTRSRVRDWPVSLTSYIFFIILFSVYIIVNNYKL